MARVLIVSGHIEPTAIHIAKECRNRGHDVYFLDYDDYNNFSIELIKGEIHLLREGELFVPEAVWVRFKKRHPNGVLNGRTAGETIAHNEWLALAQNLAALYKDITLNQRAAKNGASAKLVQLKMAAQAGFTVCKTAVFTGKENALGLIESGPLIMKSLGFPMYHTAEGGDELYSIVTTEVPTLKLLEAAQERFRSPICFQDKISQGIEHRVHVFGDEVFAYSDGVPVEKRLVLDGRVLPARYTPTNLKPEILQCFKNYMKISRLDYGIFDIIIDGDTPLFLECNPEGQWHAGNTINGNENVHSFVNLIEKKVQSRDVY